MDLSIAEDIGKMFGIQRRDHSSDKKFLERIAYILEGRKDYVTEMMVIVSLLNEIQNATPLVLPKPMA